MQYLKSKNIFDHGRLFLLQCKGKKRPSPLSVITGCGPTKLSSGHNQKLHFNHFMLLTTSFFIKKQYIVEIIHWYKLQSNQLYGADCI